MRKLRIPIALLVCVLLLAGMLVGCGGAKQTEEKKGLKEEIVIGVIQNPTSLDPHFSTANASRLITNCIYNSLVFMNVNTLKFEPDLAKSWEMPADNVYIFHLRDDVKFHDGKKMTAKDVKYSFEHCLATPGAKAFVDMIETIETPDDYTVKLTLKNPSPAFLGNMSHTITSIIPEGSGDTIADKPIGTGPYKFVEWSTDNYVLLERFDEFYGGAKPTKKLRIRIIPDNTARNLALEAHDIDVAHQIQNADYSMLENKPDIKVLKAPSVLVEYLGLQVEKPPFDDVHARKAVAYALNKDAYIKAVYRGDYLNAKSFVNAKVLGYNENVKTYEYSVEKAKEELAKSKYAKGFEFNVYTTRARGAYTESLQHDLSQIGIKMNVEFVENVQSQCKAGYTGGHITSVQYPALDPDIMYNYLHSTKKGAGGNLFWYENKKVDELLDKGRFEMDPEKRVAMYKEIQDILAEDVPVIPLHSLQAMIGTLSNVKGVDSHPTTVHYFYNVYAEN